MQFLKAANGYSLRGKRGTRVLLIPGQRSAGRHIWGPIWLSTEWHNYGGVRYWNLTIGNPKVHYRWAFSFWIYFTLGRK